MVSTRSRSAVITANAAAGQPEISSTPTDTHKASRRTKAADIVEEESDVRTRLDVDAVIDLVSPDVSPLPRSAAPAPASPPSPSFSFLPKQQTPQQQPSPGTPTPPLTDRLIGRTLPRTPLGSLFSPSNEAAIAAAAAVQAAQDVPLPETPPPAAPTPQAATMPAPASPAPTTAHSRDARSSSNGGRRTSSALLAALLILPALLSCGVHLLVCPAQLALPHSVAAWMAPVCSRLGGAQLSTAALLSQLSDRAQQQAPQAHAAAAQLFSQAQAQAGGAARRALAFVSVELPAHAAAVVQQLPEGVQQALARSRHLVSQVLAAAYGDGADVARGLKGRLAAMRSAPAKAAIVVEEAAPAKAAIVVEEEAPPAEAPAAAAVPEVSVEVSDASSEATAGGGSGGVDAVGVAVEEVAPAEVEVTQAEEVEEASDVEQ